MIYSHHCVAMGFRSCTSILLWSPSCCNGLLELRFGVAMVVDMLEWALGAASRCSNLVVIVVLLWASGVVRDGLCRATVGIKSLGPVL